MNGRLDVQPGKRVRVPAGTRWIQFTEALADRQHDMISDWLGKHPEANLRVYGNYGGKIPDLDFLQHYSAINGFEIDCMHGSYPDMTGLRFLPSTLQRLRLGVPSGDPGRELLARCSNLTEFSIAEHKQLPIELARLQTVRKLGVAGPVKSLDQVAPLTSVEELRLGGVTVAGLGALTAMRHLRSIEITLGGTRDLSALPEFKNLRYLNLVMIRGFSDLSMLGDVKSLEHLRLEAMKNVVELPSLAKLTRLRELELHTMKGLQDLRPVADAPSLEILSLTSAMHLQPEVVQPLVGHPTLRRARLGFGSDRKNDRAMEILGLPA